MRDPVFGSCPEIQMVQGGRVRSEESHHQRRIVVVYCAVRKRFKARKWRRCDAVVYMHQERRALCPHIESFLGNVVLVVQLCERREEREEREEVLPRLRHAQQLQTADKRIDSALLDQRTHRRAKGASQRRELSGGGSSAMRARA